jgi:HlyD family secretion protein
MIALAIAVALGTAGLGLFAYLSSRQSSAVTDRVTSELPAETPVQAITGLGRLEPEGGLTRVAAPSSMGTVRVNKLLVQEGSVVRSGQPLAVMDTSDRLLAATIQAEAEVREAQSRLAQVQAGAKTGDIAAAEADVARVGAQLKNAQRDYERYRVLYQNGAISAADLDARRLTLEVASKELEQSNQVLRSVAEVRPTDIRQAEAQVTVAMANLQRAKSELETAVIRSPMSGRVIEIYADPGEKVGEDGILELGNTSQMYAVAEIYETDIAKVRVGQTATITSNAFPGKVAGTVDHIGLQIRKNDVLNTDPAADTDARVIEVKIKLADSPKVAGFTNLQVNVAIAL